MQAWCLTCATLKNHGGSRLHDASASERNGRAMMSNAADVDSAWRRDVFQLHCVLCCVSHKSYKCISTSHGLQDSCDFVKETRLCLLRSITVTLAGYRNHTSLVRLQARQHLRKVPEVLVSR